MNKKQHSFYKKLSLFTLISLVSISNPRIAGADDVSDLLGKITPPPGAAQWGSFEEGLIPFLNSILRIIFAIGGLYGFFNLIFAGFKFMQAGGDPKAIQAAWGKIWQSFLGLLILVLSFLIAALIGIILFGDATAILNPKITGAPGP